MSQITNTLKAVFEKTDPDKVYPCITGATGLLFGKAFAAIDVTGDARFTVQSKAAAGGGDGYSFAISAGKEYHNVLVTKDQLQQFVRHLNAVLAAG